MTRLALLALAALYPLLANAQGNGENGGVDDQDGASGPSPGSWNLSHGGLVAIIVIVSVIGAFGIASAVLFYVAKKRQWEIRASLRRASRKMASQVSLRSPRPRQASSRHGTVNMQPSREERTRDLEKGQPRASTREMREHRSGDERRQDARRENRHQSSQQPRSHSSQQPRSQSTQQSKTQSSQPSRTQSGQHESSQPRPQPKAQPKQDPLQFPQEEPKEEPKVESKWKRIIPESWSVGRKGTSTEPQP